MASIVERFLHWSRHAPAGRRVEAAQALAQAFLRSELKPEEREQAEAALTMLLDDPAPGVRQALAEVLAPSAKAPQHIILALAADKPQIAAIVAERSPLLLDSELVDMLGGGEASLQLAIAQRPYVSRAVAAALAEVAGTEACLALLGNGGARLPRFSLDRIIERHGDCPELRAALLERDDLPLDARQALVARLCAALGTLVAGHGWLARERAEAVAREAGERATIAAAFEAPADDMAALVEQLIRTDALTPAFLIRAAASGQAMLFSTALAVLAGMPHERVTSLIASGRTSGLEALLKRAKLPPRTFPAFVAAVDVIRRGAEGEDGASDYRRATRLIEAIVTQYAKRPDRELDQILALLRRFALDAKRSAARSYAQQVLEAA
jgi:uncharacterized protein (DUF2336 family)